VGLKRKPKDQDEKEYNLEVMDIGIKKFMRNNPISGENYRKEEAIKELFERPPRQFRKRYISR